MIALYTIAGAVLILGFWAFVLWLGARADQKHLDREHAKRVFGESETNG